MALQYVKLSDIQYVANTAGSLYSNPASTKTFIRAVILFNGNSTNETVKLYNVPDSAGSVGTADASNQFAELILLPQETVIYEFKYPITLSDTNDSIQGSTTTSSKVTFQILGAKDA